MIKTKVPTYKNRPRFVKAFAYFCLEKYKNMLKKSLFPNVEAKGINHGKHQLIKEDGTFVDFDSFINNLKVKILPASNVFIFYYLDKKDKTDLFRELYFSKKLESQAACFQKATHQYNRSYNELLSYFYLSYLRKTRTESKQEKWDH